MASIFVILYISTNQFKEKEFADRQQNLTFLGAKAPLGPASSEGLYVCLYVCLYATL